MKRFDLIKKEFGYIGGTKEDVEIAIEDIKNKVFDIRIRIEDIGKNHFLHRGWFLYRLAKIWKLGYRPKDKNQFCEMFCYIKPHSSTEYSFPSRQFLNPIMNTGLEMEKYVSELVERKEDPNNPRRMYMICV